MNQFIGNVSIVWPSYGDCIITHKDLFKLHSMQQANAVINDLELTVLKGDLYSALSGIGKMVMDFDVIAPTSESLKVRFESCDASIWFQIHLVLVQLFFRGCKSSLCCCSSRCQDITLCAWWPFGLEVAKTPANE